MDGHRKLEEKRGDGQPRIKKFTVAMQKKLFWLFLVIMVAFVVLSVQLYNINQNEGDTYTRQVLSQQQYTSTTIPYKRGEIVDANGTKLAISEKVYDVILNVKLMSEDTSCVEPTLSALVSCLDLDSEAEEKLRTYVEEHPTSQYRAVAKELTYEEISELSAAMEENSLITGVYYEEGYTRYYPYGSLASDIIGFVGSDNNGNYGLEQYYDDTLNGTNGREYGYINDDSNLERTTKAAVDGNNLVLTIDANIQSIVEDALADFNDTYQNNAYEGNGARNVGCIIMEVDTGNILAMASYPNYDLNDPQNAQALLGSNKIELVDDTWTVSDEMVTQEDIDQWTADYEAGNDSTELYQQLNALWKNFCISSTYEPGSVMKPFTVATGLESGALTGDEVYVCNGSLTIVEGETAIKCHNIYGDGEVSVKRAVEISCNVALMKMGQTIGEETFLKYMDAYNFGLKTNVDLAGEVRTASLVFTEDTMGPTELATSTFGQGFNVTMIQMITGFCSLINGGYYYEPHLVSQITASDGSVVENIEPRVLKQTVSSTTSELIREYCLEVVAGDEGTGKTARPAGYMIGGKTGTAETLPRGNGEYVVSFMGYAPADDPEIAIYVVVDRPNATTQDDAKFATRIVRSVLTQVLPYLDIFMTEELTEDEIAELEELEIAYKESLLSSEEESESEEEDSSDTQVSESGEETGEETAADTQTQEDSGTDSGQSETDSETESETVTDEETVEEYDWASDMTIDEETGYGVLSDGTLVDPDTGEVIGNVELNLPDATLPLTESGDEDEDSPL